MTHAHVHVRNDFTYLLINEAFIACGHGNHNNYLNVMDYYMYMYNMYVYNDGLYLFKDHKHVKGFNDPQLLS